MRIFYTPSFLSFTIWVSMMACSEGQSTLSSDSNSPVAEEPEDVTVARYDVMRENLLIEISSTTSQSVALQSSGNAPRLYIRMGKHEILCPQKEVVNAASIYECSDVPRGAEKADFYLDHQLLNKDGSMSLPQGVTFLKF